jgi:two-component system, cell cycle sensor histidine kinase and response regulator CckA
MTTILVIDDKNNNLVTAMALLKNLLEDCTVLTAQSGAEGLAIAREFLPDTILLDIKMPDMDGFQVCTLLKADDITRSIPIIILTAEKIDCECKIRGLELGADAFLTEPIDAGELAAQVKAMLRLKMAEDKLREEKDSLQALVVERTNRLQQFEESYAALFDSAGDAIFVIENKTFAILDVNPAGCLLYGYEKQELLTMNFISLCVEPHRIATAINARARNIPPHNHRRQNGEVFPVEITTGFLEKHGLSIHTAIVHDVTERKRLQHQLIQAQKMESVGTLAGGVAHDFNNILTAIIGNATLIEMRNDGRDDKIAAFTNEILKASYRATNLTNSLLTYSRKYVASTERVNLNEIVSKVETLLHHVINEDIVIKIKTTDTRLPVMVDINQMELVIVNLATNARDAMPAGGTLSIATSLVRAADDCLTVNSGEYEGLYAQLAVSDTGIGMSDKTIERIFDPFFTTKEVNKGTGLGLSIVFGVITQHDGCIKVLSKPGDGTTFLVRLPLIGETSSRLVKNTARDLRRGTETILLAEDNEMVRSIVRNLLEDFGYRVFEAVDGREGLQLFMERKDSIDLVIMDVIMPVMNGKDAYDEMKRLCPELKAIFTSGYTADILNEKGIQKNQLNFLPKPLALDGLLAKVREVLDQ